MQELISILKALENGGYVILPNTPPQTIPIRDVVMARYIVDLFRDGELNKSLRVWEIITWFESKQMEVATFHLWNAWHKN